MKYIFDIRDGPTVFLQERKGNIQRDQRIHTALRLIGLLLIRDREPVMEPRRGIYHRKYAPDVISGDGRLWVEAGKVSPGKLADLASSADLERILVVQADPAAARRNAERLAAPRRLKNARTPLTFWGWQSDDVLALAHALYGRNEVEVHDEGNGVLDFTINGERLEMRAGVWEVTNEGLRDVADGLRPS